MPANRWSRHAVSALAATTAVVGLGLLGPVQGAVAAVGGPRAISLGTLGGLDSTPIAINDSGQVTGYSSVTPGTHNPQHAFSWTFAGGMVDLGTLGGSESQASALNSGGEIVGFSDLPGDASSVAFKWTPGGTMEALSGLPGATYSGANAVNDSGLIVGYSDVDGVAHAVSWSPSGQITDLGFLPGGDQITYPSADATGVDNNGDIVGTSSSGSNLNGNGHAFLLPAGGSMISLEQDSWVYSKAVDIDSSGEVTGFGNPTDNPVTEDAFVYTTAGGFDQITHSGPASGYEVAGISDSGFVAGITSGQHAFGWSADAGLIDLGDLGGGWAVPTGVSKNGVVVGASQLFGGRQEGFAWTSHAGMVGLPGLPGNDAASASAVNDNGLIVGISSTFSAGSEAVIWGLVQAPAITSAATASAAMRSPFAFTVTTAGSPTPGISESGALPAGITFVDNGDGTATFSGTPALGSGGTYPLTLTAANGVGTAATQAFSLVVPTTASVPTITSADNTTATFGVPFSFTVSTTGYPAPKLSKTGAVPASVTFVNNGDGTATISGTPAKAAAGVYPLTIAAKNAAGTATLDFSLTISKAPIIKAIPNTSVIAGVPFSIPVTATGYQPPIVRVGGVLPPGVHFQYTNDDETAGVLTGTPQASSGGAVYPITVFAQNDVGTVTQTFTLTITRPPTFFSQDNATATSKTPFSFQVLVIGNPLPKVTKVGALPKGLTWDATTQTISGTPKAAAAPGDYPLTFTAKNSAGTVTQAFTLTLQ